MLALLPSACRRAGQFTMSPALSTLQCVPASYQLDLYRLRIERGVALRTNSADSELLARYGRAVVASKLRGPLKAQILGLANVRKRARRKLWKKARKTSTYANTFKAVMTAPGLSRSVRGAALALIA